MGSNNRRRASPCSRLWTRIAAGCRRWRERDRGCRTLRRFSRRPPSRRIFVANEVVVALTPGDHCELLSVDEHFCGTWAGVVIGSHDEAVGTGGLHRKKIARLGVVDLPVEGEEVSALADRTDHVGYRRATGGMYCVDAMKRVVVRGAQEIGHPRVGDDELFTTASLPVENAGEKHAGVADQKSPRL